MKTTEYLSPSRFPQQEIDHPATPNVRTGSAAVVQDVGVVAPGLFEGVRENRHPVERPLGVDAVGERDDRFGEPTGIEGDGAEGVAEDLSNQESLYSGLFASTS